MICRKILPNEIDATMILMNYYRNEAAENVPSIDNQWDDNSMVKTIRLYASHYEYVWINAFEGQRSVGLISGCITQCPWNQDIFNAHIDMIYLLESHRSMANFKQLYNAFEEWAKLSNAHTITAGDIGINLERTRRVYEHIGFKEGVWMSKEMSE